jgi:hypothetical protein
MAGKLTLSQRRKAQKAKRLRERIAREQAQAESAARRSYETALAFEQYEYEQALNRLVSARADWIR